MSLSITSTWHLHNIPTVKQGLDLNPNKHFWINLKTSVPIQLDRAREDLLKRMTENPQILASKSYHIIPKKSWAVIVVKGASTRYWVKGLDTYAMSYFIYLFIYLLQRQICFLLSHYVTMRSHYKVRLENKFMCVHMYTSGNRNTS